MVPGRRRRAVDLAVEVHGVGRHPLQGRVRQEEHRAGVADSCRVLLVESRHGQFFTRVEVVVAEDEHAFARAAGEVELQRRLSEFHGIGQEKAAMAVEILNRDLGRVQRQLLLPVRADLFFR